MTIPHTTRFFKEEVKQLSKVCTGGGQRHLLDQSDTAHQCLKAPVVVDVVCLILEGAHNSWLGALHVLLLVEDTKYATTVLFVLEINLLLLYI